MSAHHLRIAHPWRGQLPAEELGELARLARRRLDAVQWVSTQPEGLEETLQLAVREQLSYCDTSYFYTAKQRKLSLATEDITLGRAASKHVRITNEKQILTAEGLPT